MAEYFQIRANLENLQIAVVADAVDDLALYRLQETLHPHIGDGNPPQTIYEGIHEECVKSASKLKEPIVRVRKEYTREEYVKRIESNKRRLAHNHYTRIRREGIMSEKFFATDWYRMWFTDLDVTVFYRAVRLKTEQMMKEVENGERTRRPPYGLRGRRNGYTRA